MATTYVRSTTGSNANNGTTWALAKANLFGALATAGAGDIIYVSQVHNETTASGVNLTFSGTRASPMRIVCGNDGAQPPTALATTAVMSTTGAAGNIIIGGCVYIYGITFQAGSGSSDSSIVLGGQNMIQRYEQCTFSLTNTGVGSTLQEEAAIAGWTELKNCNLKIGAVGQGCYFINGWHWNGGSMVSGSSTPTNFLNIYRAGATDAGGRALIENFDFSNVGATMNLSVSGTKRFNPVFRNCKLPAAWSGSLVSNSFSGCGRIEMYNSDSGSTNYKLWIEDDAGTIKDETTIVRSGGATDGATTISWKMASSTGAVYPAQTLDSPEFVIYNSSTGSAKTVTVEGIHDSVTALTDHDVWLEVCYLGASGTPLGTVVSSQAADVLTTANSLTASTKTWSTGSMTNPNKWSLAVTFTPQKKGYFHCRVMLSKASQTIYIDPKISVTP